tara:strand:- start:1037 stop:1918 length:882 start_codon:yes stop_codon:yes gene_type:complete
MIPLDVSCLGSCYKNTKPKDLFFSLMSLFLESSKPKQVLLVIDGPIGKDLKKIIYYFVENFKIQILDLKRNQGLGIALSKGLKKCKCNYVARFDTDDINLPNRLEKQLQYLKNNPHISVVGSNVFEYRKIGNYYENRHKLVPESYKNISLFIYLRNCMNHPTVLFKKVDILNIGSYKNRIYFEDYDLWLRLIDNNYKFANLSESLVLMKREDASIRREGFSYIKKEFLFIKKVDIKITKKLVLFFVFLLKVLLRVIFSSKVLNFLPWRTKWKRMNVECYQRIKLLDNCYKTHF